MLAVHAIRLSRTRFRGIKEPATSSLNTAVTLGAIGYPLTSGEVPVHSIQVSTSTLAPSTERRAAPVTHQTNGQQEEGKQMRSQSLFRAALTAAALAAVLASTLAAVGDSKEADVGYSSDSEALAPELLDIPSMEDPCVRYFDLTHAVMTGEATSSDVSSLLAENGIHDSSWPSVMSDRFHVATNRCMSESFPNSRIKAVYFDLFLDKQQVGTWAFVSMDLEKRSEFLERLRMRLANQGSQGSEVREHPNGLVSLTNAAPGHDALLSAVETVQAGSVADWSDATLAYIESNEGFLP